jgi:tRNA(Ile)-lysidine synthase
MRRLLEQKVIRAIRHGHMMAAGDRVAVAVSGGSDSVALLRLLGDLRNTLGITLLVAHFDHSLRGAESDADAQFVASLCRDQSLQYICEREDVAAVADRDHLNLEDAARRLRYAFFQRIVESGFASRVAVGHTADDQAETVLARIFRGTGPSGLAGIYPVRAPMVRPLLAIRREELREYLRGLGQQWREDSSNFDPTRQRAKIRKHLLPSLEKDFSPRIVTHLGELARLSREEQQFWASLVDDRFRTLVRKNMGRLTIKISDLFAPLGSGSLHPEISLQSPAPALRSLTERLIRRLYEGVRGNCQDLSSEHVEQVIHLAAACVSGSRRELPGGVIAERNFESLMFVSVESKRTRHSTETDCDSHAYQYEVGLPTTGEKAISVPELGSRFLLKVIDCSCTERDTNLQGALDLGLLDSTLILRNWKFGDAYKPRGHCEMRKLKQLFLAHRVPRGERARWPVIVSGGHIVWARGMPLAIDFCAGERTMSALLIEEVRS